MRADSLIARARRQDELAVRDRIPVGASPIDRAEVRESALERHKDMRLNQPLPERPHFLARQHGEQIHTLLLQAPHRPRQQLRLMARVRVDEQQQLALRYAVALDDRPLLPKPSRRRFHAAHQLQSVTGGRLDDLGRAIGRGIVYHDHFNRGIARRQHGADAALDVARLVAGRNDDGNERAGGQRLVIAQARAGDDVSHRDEQ